MRPSQESTDAFLHYENVLALVVEVVVSALNDSPEIQLEQETIYTNIVIRCPGI
jgi:hypothetical protein